MGPIDRDYEEYLESLGFSPARWIESPAAESAAQPLTAPAVLSADVSTEWTTLATVCSTCTMCPLAIGRTHAVFGTGDRQARLMFVGEGPGTDEDLSGEPFVGKAGQLLTRMIEAMKLTRETVYITNVVKCRPPDNRNPLPEEIGVCVPNYLEKQIALVQPDIIVALGSIATKTLLLSDESITHVRGKFHPLALYANRRGEPVAVMPTFHPAFLLRNPDMKKHVWEDLKLVMGELGLPV